MADIILRDIVAAAIVPVIRDDGELGIANEE